MRNTANPVVDLVSEQNALYYLDDGSPILPCVGSPNNVIAARIGAMAIDMQTGIQYLKQSDDGGVTGWVQTSDFGSQNGGILASARSDVSNSGAPLTQLHTFTFPAGTLRADGDWLELFATGYTAANANTKRLTVDINGVNILDTGLGAQNNLGWQVWGRIVRVSATAAWASLEYSNFSTAIAAGQVVGNLTFPVAVNNLGTQTNTINTNGQSGAATSADIHEIMLQVSRFRQ